MGEIRAQPFFLADSCRLLTISEGKRSFPRDPDQLLGIKEMLILQRRGGLKPWKKVESCESPCPAFNLFVSTQSMNKSLKMLLPQRNHEGIIAEGGGWRF